MRTAVRLTSSTSPGNTRGARRAGLGGEVHARPVRVNTIGAESLAVLFLILICLAALVTSFAGGTRGGATPQVPPAAPHAAALTAQ